MRPRGASPRILLGALTPDAASLSRKIPVVPRSVRRSKKRPQHRAPRTRDIAEMLNALKARKALLSQPSAQASEAQAGEGGASRPPKAKWGALDYSKWDDIGNSSDENDDKESSSAASTLKDAINEAMRDLVPAEGEEGASEGADEGPRESSSPPEPLPADDPGEEEDGEEEDEEEGESEEGEETEEYTDTEEETEEADQEEVGKAEVMPGDVVLTGDSLHHEERLGVYRRRDERCAAHAAATSFRRRLPPPTTTHHPHPPTHPARATHPPAPAAL